MEYQEEEEIKADGTQELASVTEDTAILPSTHHVDVGPAVLKKYFEVVDQLKKSELKNSILRSEIDFTIHFIERMTDIEKSTELQVVLSKLRRALRTAQPGVAADGSRLHIGPQRQMLRRNERPVRAGKRGRG